MQGEVVVGEVREGVKWDWGWGSEVAVACHVVATSAKYWAIWDDDGGP